MGNDQRIEHSGQAPGYSLDMSRMTQSEAGVGKPTRALCRRGYLGGGLYQTRLSGMGY